MKPIETPMDGEIWTREIDALRALARALLGDEHAADDAVQETWLRARTRAPAAAVRPGAWLAAVLRNLVRDRQRAEARRRQREHEAAAERGLPSPDEVAERLELAQRVAAVAAELREPYRTTIHLRYFEGLAAGEIAARAGIPLETVRTRVRRGLEQMRGRLDGLFGGDRKAWSLALAPLAPRTGPPGAAATATGAALSTFGGALAMSKIQLGAACAVLFAAAVLFVALRGRAAAPSGEGAAAAPAELHSPREPRAPGPAEPAAQRVAVAALSESPAPAPAPATGDGRVELLGTLVMTDTDGSEHPATTGQFNLAVAAPGREERSLPVYVLDGRWEARVPVDALLRARDLLADSRGADVDTPARTPPRDGALELKATWWPRARLRVVDAASGRDLRRIELRAGMYGYSGMATLHPGDLEQTQLLARDETSPLELATPTWITRRGVVRYWVRAPGYAWGFCDVVPRGGGARSVELRRCGSLEVRALDPRPDGALTVQILEPGTTAENVWDPLARMELPAEGAIVLESLAAGRYLVRIVAAGFGRPVLGSTEVEVLPGSLERAQIALNPGRLDAPRTHLTGTLRLPEGTVDRFAILYLIPEPFDSLPGQEQVVLPRESMRPDEGDSDLLHWDAGRVQCGAYIASLQGGVVYEEILQTGLAPESSFAIEVPPLVEVEIEVVDAATGVPVEGALVFWAFGSKEASRRSWSSVQNATGRDRARFESPAGEVTVRVSAEGWVESETSQRLVPGRVNAVRLALQRTTGFRLEFYEGDARVLIFPGWPDVFDLEKNEPVDLLGRRGRTSDVLLRVDPGAYEVSYPGTVEGYAHPEPLQVLVQAGEVTPVRVQLQREDE